MASKAKSGFKGIGCIKCGETDVVRVELHNTANFVCSSCDEEFTVEDVKAVMEAWAKVITWVESAPSL